MKKTVKEWLELIPEKTFREYLVNESIRRELDFIEVDSFESACSKGIPYGLYGAAMNYERLNLLTHDTNTR